MATHHLAAVEHEIHEFFTDFVAAFCTFDGVRVAERYHAPGIALCADGSIDVMQSHAGDHRDGCRGLRFKDLHVVPIGAHAVLGTVTWELLREDGCVLRRWRQSYNLVRVEAAWMVFASTHHVE